MTRQIALDTETTGMPASDGHRIIEIGAVEMVDRQPTGNTYHVYLNPERDIDAGAQSVHGLSRAFLADKALFSDVVDEFLAFIEGSELLIHNAAFDVGFINAELKRLGRVVLEAADVKITDTLALARQRRKKRRNSLDQLCKDYGISLASRGFHGALLDAQLLQQVYVALTAEQAKLIVALPEAEGRQDLAASSMDGSLVHAVSVSDALLEKHAAYRAWMTKQEGGCLWDD
jgi:DNA polymerase III subunit epsilon